MTLIRTLFTDGLWGDTYAFGYNTDNNGNTGPYYLAGDIPVDGVPGYAEWVTKQGVECLKISIDGYISGTSGTRTEIRAATEEVATGVPVERWYSWNTLFPAAPEFPADTDTYTRFAFMQVHETSDSGNTTARWPNLVMMAGFGEIQVWLPQYDPPTQNSAHRVVSLAPLVRDHWYSFVVHSSWSKEAGTGFLEIFIDGRPVYHEYGRATSYDDILGPYFKMGIYNILRIGGSATNYCTVYHANVKHYSSPESYSNVVGNIINNPGSVW